MKQAKLRIFFHTFNPPPSLTNEIFNIPTQKTTKIEQLRNIKFKTFFFQGNSVFNTFLLNVIVAIMNAK